jgi:uncharacterized Zn finger protein
MSRWGDEWWEHAPSRPRKARGGIKARSKRGTFAETWWGRRWLAALERLSVGGRLQRGRSYARKGQVLDLTITPGKVTARVQGSRPLPYSVSIGIATIGRPARRKIGEALAANLRIAAGLMAGEMPPEIEQTFADAKLPLFPQRADELVIKCSCPDWSNPCKHVAAVYYLLAEEFDRDPFLLFHLRGIEREEMAQLIDAAPIAGAAKASIADDTAETLPTDIASFWRGTAITGSSTGGVKPPTSPAPVAKRLGGFPFWRGDEDFLDALAQAYQVATARGMEIYLSTLVP